MEKILEEVQQHSNEEYVVSEIIGRTILLRGMRNIYCPLSQNIITVQMT